MPDPLEHGKEPDQAVKQEAALPGAVKAEPV